MGNVERVAPFLFGSRSGILAEIQIPAMKLRFKITLLPFRPKLLAKKAALSALCIYFVLCVALFFLQDHLLYHPSSDAELALAIDSNPNVVETRIPTAVGFTAGRSTGT